MPLANLSIRQSHINIETDTSTLKSIDDHFAFADPNAFHIQRHHKEIHRNPNPRCWQCNWDGKRRFLKKNRLPIGFLPDLVEFLDSNGITVIKNYDYKIPDKEYNWSSSINLRDYQQDAVSSAIAAGRGVISAATGAGKTIIAASIVAHYGLPSMICVPTKVIMGQFIETFREHTDIEVGCIGSGKFEEAPVQVGIMASLSKNSSPLIGKQLIIVDEFHISSAKTWSDTISKCQAPYRFGLSATPFRHDDLGNQYLRSLCGDTIYTVKTAELQDNGYLAPADIRFFQVPCSYSQYDEEGCPIPFATQYDDAITFNIERNSLICELIEQHVKKQEKVLVIVARKDHAELLQSLITCDSIYLSGDDTQKQTEMKRKQFIEMQGGVCIGTQVVDIGFDVPAVDVLIMACGGKYKGRAQQRLGRGLRPSPGKEKVIVYDFIDDDRNISKRLMYKHSQSRIQTYQDLGQTVTIIERGK